VRIDKRLLDRMEMVGLTQTFDGNHRCFGYLAYQHQAGAHRVTVNEDCAGATLPHATAFLGASEAKTVAKKVEQPVTECTQLNWLTVDLHATEPRINR
jgi:hypothetical protein